MSGLRFESLADMPEGMRKIAAGKLLEGTGKALPVAGASEKAPKYHNVKTDANGIMFDSKKEARRYEYLCMAQKLGVIRDLRLQVDFTLQEAYTTADGLRIHAIRYKADFTYKTVSAGYDRMEPLDREDLEFWRSLWPGALVVEDVKSRGTRTGKYMMKKKMMADKGYIIREV